MEVSFVCVCVLGAGLLNLLLIGVCGPSLSGQVTL